ncbi:MAG: bifunctional folylpolyglutamate synthase/dihydrofolate synthase [Nitrospinae bacterium]|nr:bifunctional folylpolyglutamate synthase/dihydrofolate synthase [Nitrospinota bacterium]
MTYVETIKFLYNLERFGIKLGLENISIILNLFDNPHKKFKSIHIAGTNGKGSTAAMTASILQYAGYKTGLYTSPHLQDFRERIMVNGAMIPEEDVVELTEIIRCKMKGSPTLPLFKVAINGGLTFFEFTTVMAFLYFSREMVDFAVVEVGLGGRLDATNVLNPVLSIITEIDIEHTDYLGEDIKSIAREKGGIIKDNGAVILSSTKTEVIETIESICKGKNAKLYRIEKDFNGEAEYSNIHYQHFDFIDKHFESQIPKSRFLSLEIPLLGKYQIMNASTSVKAALVLNEAGFKIGEKAIHEGLKNVRWNGRLEIVSENPLFILDGAHNPAAAKALSEELEGMSNSKFGIQIHKIILIIGILKDKDFKGIISLLAQIADYIIIVKPKTLRSRNPDDLKDEFFKYTEGVEIIEDIPDAISKAKNIATVNDLICITGSFFTVGEAIKFIKFGVES